MLFGEERKIGNGIHHVQNKAFNSFVPGMLNLTGIFQFIVNLIIDGPYSEQYFFFFANAFAFMLLLTSVINWRLKPKSQPMVDLLSLAMPIKTLFRLIFLLWHILKTVGLMKLMPVHLPLQQWYKNRMNGTALRWYSFITWIYAKIHLQK